MNPKLIAVIAFVGVILSGFALWGSEATASSFHSLEASLATNFGVQAKDLVGNSQGGPVFNAGANFPAGYQLGTLKQNLSAGSLDIGPGQNQASWCNTGPGIVVYDAWAFLQSTTTAYNSLSSSTYNVYVGTSTGATIKNDFLGYTAALINGALFATSTQSNQVIADNSASHSASSTSTVYVASGVCLNLQVQQTYGCTADAKCNTATSSARGWSSLSVPFLYKQR